MLFIPYVVSAQMQIDGTTKYGNEWIDYDKTYFKFQTGEEGIYRITHAELSAAGVFSTGSIPQGSHFQLYRMGREIPVYVSTNGTFGGNDFIEFFATPNDSELDVHLYDDPSDVPNPKKSLFSDNASYFLTWEANAANLRIQGIANDLSNPPSAEPYCIVTESKSFSNTLFRGVNYGSSDNWKCEYDMGEGFVNSTFGNNQSFTFDTPQAVNVGVSASLSSRIVSKNGAHNIEIDINGNNVLNDNYQSWAVRSLQTDIPASALSSSTNITIKGTSNEDDKFHVGYIDLTYTHSFDFDNAGYFRFKVPARNTGNYLDISNFNSGSQAPVLYDLTNNLRLETNLSGASVRAFLPSSTSERELVLIIKDSQKSTVGLQKRELIDYNVTGSNNLTDYIILTHQSFMDDGNGNNYIQDYADYRSTPQGGNYNVKVVEVTQLYDQFGYGINRHEVSIRNFLRLAHENMGAKMLNIIGKGVDYRIMRLTPNGNMAQFDFVPSFGNPNSDHLFVTNQGTIKPNMAVGRVAAKNPEQVRIYLDKIKEHEEALLTTPQTIEEKAWMKKILHFGGGDAQIQNLIQGELNDLASDIESYKFGANVRSFFKKSTDVITNAADDDVIDLINEGASVLTFFGHSAPSTLDFDLGNPENYSNKGKYPLFYAIGCNTNRMFETENSLSEDFVFIEDKGCIGFFGATWITALSSLSQYAKYFYENIGEDNYGQTVGEAIKATIEDYSFSNSYTASLLRNALILQGDPAIRLYPHTAPDYLTNVQKSTVEPNIINAQEEEYVLNLNLANIGFANVDSFNVKIQQEKPNGAIVDLMEKRVLAPSFDSEFALTLPLDSDDALGRNNLVITVDADNEAEEQPATAEMNNISKVPFYVVANDIFPVSPSEFSIVSDNSVTLKASTANAFSETIKYYFEIDTSELFTNPLAETQITQEGGVVEWEPPITMTNNTVYYWRVSVDSTIISGSGFNWHSSSFTYVDGSPSGWNQGHYFQKLKDERNGIYTNATTREEEFGSITIPFRSLNGAIGFYNFEQIILYRDGFTQFAYFPCPGAVNGNRRLWAFSYRSDNLEIRQTSPGQPSFHCFGGPEYIAMKKADDPQERKEFMDFLNNDVPDNDYVIIWTLQSSNNDYHADEWASDSITYGRNLFQVLEEAGAKKVRNLVEKQTPYILMYQKGNPDFPVAEVHAESLDELVEITHDFIGLDSKGSMSSTLIGPSKNWRSLEWQLSDYDANTEDASIDIYGINTLGDEVLLHQGVHAFDTTLQHISAANYPYLKLKYNAVDSLNRTPAQLDYWRVLFDPVPEAAIAPNKLFVFQADTLQQGQPLHLEVAVENIGIADMDSVLVNYTITDASNNEQVVSKRMAPLLKDQTLTATLDLPTEGLFGDNQILIDVNPDNDQPELTHFNNVGLKSFHVVGDKRNPLLDVTFDGVRILDGDIVSAKPMIDISLTDENPYLALDDTSLLRVFLVYPDTNEEEIEIPVDNDVLTFVPAESGGTDGNRARMEFRPNLEIDGTYKLIVRGRDKSGNKSGDTDYRVFFEVINETMVSNVLNYPNPFSTSTQFVFTLTGDALPDFMKIQIMTVGGRVVREVTMDELGPIRIGNNKSEFKWDGTDEYGDKLANGVYLYRVVTKKEGEEYEIYDTNTNQYFKNGFGKMMILR